MSNEIVENTDVDHFSEDPQEEGLEVVAPSTEDQGRAFSEKESFATENSKEDNWRTVNSVMLEQSKMIKAQNERIAQMEKEQVKTRPLPAEEVELAEDDLVSSKQVKSLVKKETEKVTHDLLEKKEMSGREANARGKFADYDEVVNYENVQRFAQKQPEIAKNLSKMLDHPHPEYDPYLLAYWSIKNFNAGGKEKKKSPEEQKLHRNLERPTRGEGISQAKSFANASKEDLLKEMEEAMRYG